MAIRSKMLAGMRGPATNVVIPLYTTPADRTGVLKAWHVSNFTDNVVGWRLFLSTPGGTRYNFAGAHQTAQTYASQNETYVVVPPAHFLGIYVLQAGGRLTEDLGVLLSGVELQGVAP